MTYVNQKNALAPAAEGNSSRAAGESAIIGLARQMGPLEPLLSTGVASEEDDAANHRLQVYQDALLSIEPRTLQEAVLQLAIAVALNDGNLQDDKDLYQQLSPVFGAAIRVLEPLIGMDRSEWSGGRFLDAVVPENEAQGVQATEVLEETAQDRDAIHLIPDGDTAMRALVLAMNDAYDKSGPMLPTDEGAPEAQARAYRLDLALHAYIPKTIGGILYQANNLANAVEGDDDLPHAVTLLARSIIEGLKSHLDAGRPIEANVDPGSSAVFPAAKCTDLLRRYVQVQRYFESDEAVEGPMFDEADAKLSVIEEEILRSDDLSAIAAFLAQFLLDHGSEKLNKAIKDIYQRMCLLADAGISDEPVIPSLMQRYVALRQESRTVSESLSVDASDEEVDTALDPLDEQLAAIEEQILQSSDFAAMAAVLADYSLTGVPDDLKELIESVHQRLVGIPTSGYVARDEFDDTGVVIEADFGGCPSPIEDREQQASPLLKRYIDHFCRADAMLAAVKAQYGKAKEGEAPFNAAVNALDEAQHELEAEILRSGDPLAREAVYGMMCIEAAQDRHSDHLYLRLDDLMGRHADGLTGNTDLSEIKRQAALIRLENEAAEEIAARATA
jgi:hypothetical protein